MARDTFENWQSEFLQLLWQVGGLAILLCVSSLQSKESTDRLEAKLDAILKVDPDEADRLIAELDHTPSAASRTSRPPTAWAWRLRSPKFKGETPPSERAVART